jgi:hypothetical protein
MRKLLRKRGKNQQKLAKIGKKFAKIRQKLGKRGAF